MYFDYSRLERYRTYSAVKPVIKVLSHIVYSCECRGRENIPAEGKLIIACNHIGTPDPAFIVANCPRRVHFMAKSDIFEKRLFAEFFTRMNAFPVVRKSADRKALRYALRVLENDLVLGIFPEGRRVRDSESVSPVDGLAGVGFLARASGADVLPSCLYRVPGDGKFRPKVVVIFGKVIKNADLGFGGENKSKEARSASEIIMNEIKALWNKAYEGDSNAD